MIPESPFWNFFSPGRLAFGWNALRNLPRILKEYPYHRILVVTDKNLAEVGISKNLERHLSDAGFSVGLFDGCMPEPSIDSALEAAAFANGFRPDAIVGLGGGSNMDLAKMTAILVTYGGEPSDYFGFGKVPGPIIPVVAIPTTAGTGSEVSHSSVLTDTQAQLKVSTLSRHLRPFIALVDPALCMTCPNKVTADSGIDALTHAIEAYLAVPYDTLPFDEAASLQRPYDGSNPFVEMLSEKAIRLVGEHLVQAFRNPEDRMAREGMSLAATLAGMAFSNGGVSLVHGLEYPIGARVHCSHGAGNGLLLPYVMHFNLPACVEKMTNIASWLGENQAGETDDQNAQSAIDQIIEIRKAVGIPHRLTDIGVTSDMLPDFAGKTHSIERLMRLNPRKVSREDLLEILKMAL